MSAALLWISATDHPGSLPGSEALGPMTMEATLPPPQIVRRLAKKRRERRRIQQQTVEDVGRKPQRFFEVDEEHHARLPRLVPCFVFVGIVENQRAPFGPMVPFGSDTNRGPVDRFRDTQTQM